MTEARFCPQCGGRLERRTAHGRERPVRPMVGIPAARPGVANRYLGVPRPYVNAIAAAGGLALPVLPCADGAALAQTYGWLDGLLLAGGGDLAAHWYGADDSSLVRYVDEERDALEIELTRWALRDGVPILGICRGIQTLNVAAGGTLVQDIPTALPHALAHAADSALGRDHIAHAVQVTSGSRLAMALGGPQAPEGDACYGVNSFHHQSVARVAPGFVVSALAPDGVIEGIEAADADYALGVQWHPEEMAPCDAAQARLFASFVAACAREARRRGRQANDDHRPT
ncbi:MAG: gamma-glutamyl-gamma-aminobutyrate hydrolase family protein [Chloroflexota bacterium]